MKKIILVFLLLTILLINSCGIFGDSVKILNFSPNGEVKRLSTFRIEFSENLAPADIIDKWLEEELIDFEPKIDGKYKWLNANTLIFTPDTPLESMQTYSAKVNNKVLYDTKFSSDFDSFDFNTPFFDIEKAEFFWNQIPNQNYKLNIKTNLYFNYDVNPSNLKQFLSVKINDKEIKDFQIINENSGQIMAINLGEVQQADKEQELEIVIKKGLTSVLGKTPLEEDKIFKYDLAPITKLAITGITAGFDGSRGWIEVATSQKVDEKKLNKYVSITNKNTVQYFVDENLFRIEGDFSQNESVRVKITKGLPGLYGGSLEYDFEQEVSFVNLNPSISFADRKGKYLMLSGENNIELNVINIPEIEYEVSQVFKNNIVYFLNQYSYSYEYYDEYDNYSPSYYIGDLGKILFTKTIKTQKANNWLNKVKINLSELKSKNNNGIFIIEARATDDRWVRAAKAISMSDIAIITKKSQNEIVVFVNSIATTDAIADVEITVISQRNQTLLTGKTDKNGVVYFRDIKDKLEDETPRVIVAEYQNDFNYLDLRETEIEKSRYDVGGTQYHSYNTKVFVYGDRNIYRPSETVNVTGIVRDDFTKIVKDLPVILKVYAPNGKVINEFKKNLNSQGSFEISFNIPSYMQTGEYSLYVHNGSQQIIGDYKFSVEEFVPDKIKVSLKDNSPEIDLGGTFKFDINSEYLFGAKASNLRYEVDMQVRHSSFSSKKYSKYNFSNNIINTQFDNNFFDGVLDENGFAPVEFIVPSDLKSSGVATIYGFVSVFDPTGRTVNRTISKKIYPEKYFVGIQSNGYYFGVNNNVNFKIVAVDKDDKIPNNMKLNAKLVRYEWQTVLKKDYSERFYYASEKKEIVEWEKTISINGKETDLSFVTQKSGEHELRISKQGKNNYTSTNFYAYGWASSTSSSFEVNKEGRIEIMLDKDVYSPNENAKILFTTPFNGKMLVTIERNGVYDYQYIEVKNRSAELKLNLKNDYIPNVYVTATLFKKHIVDNSTPFLVGHGFASIKVENKSNKLNVSIEAPSKIKPNTKQKIKVKTNSEKDIYVTLAAVDEGILQIKNYVTPDPYYYMYAKQPLLVDSYNLYQLLLPEIVKGSSSSGGDAFAAQMQKRTNPITSNRFKLLAYWSGIKKTDSNGEVEIELNIPQYNGEIRLVAVAHSGSRFGSSDAKMKVSDDLVIESQIPRFLAPNDLLQMPVTIINTTNSKGNATVNIKVSGPIKIKSKSSANVSLNPNSSAKVNFEIETLNQTGNAKIIIETSGLAKVKDEIEIAVRPISPFVTESNVGTIYANKEISIDISKDFYADNKSSKIIISSFPSIKYAKQLRNLVGYPHGCLEQTISKVFPQLYYDDIVKFVASEYFQKSSPQYFINEGIKKIESMQLWDGSLAYWYGGNEASWWGSVYAAHFLIEAKKAGFNISENVFEKLLNYIAKKATQKSTYDYVTYNNNSKTVKKIANKEILYSLYVLALAGKGDISIMNYYKAQSHLVSNDSKYFLAAAYALMNNWNSYYSIVPEKFNREISNRESGGSFDSEIRANSIMLNILLDVEPNNRQIPILTKYLAEKLNSAFSTQETSFLLLALGKAAKKSSNNNLKVEIFADSKIINTFNGKNISQNIDKSVKNIKLKSSGKGEVYYFLYTEGVKKAEVVERSSLMNVTRTYYDYKTGSQITNNQFYQGQLVRCKIRLTGMSMSVDNIAISDLLPAAFEIENSRLADVNRLDYNSSNNMKLDYLDIRDDRLNIYTKLLSNRTVEYEYLIRVVNKGKFQLPVIRADAMYDPEYFSVTGRGVITVNEK